MSVVVVPPAADAVRDPSWVRTVVAGVRALSTLALLGSALASTAPFALELYYGSTPTGAAGGIKHATGLFLAACALGTVLPGLAYWGLRRADEGWPTAGSVLARIIVATAAAVAAATIVAGTR